MTVPSERTDHIDPDQDEIPTGTEQPTQLAPKDRELDFLAQARRALSEEELDSPVVRRFLIADIERLNREKNELLAFRERFYEVDKKLGVLSSRVSAANRFELLHVVALAIGSAMLGAAPSYIPLSSFGWFFAVASAALIVAALVIKMLGQKNA